MEDNFFDSVETSFPLFSIVALHNSAQKGCGASLISSDDLDILPQGFSTPVMFTEALEPIRKKRGRKVIPVATKDTYDPNITIREIIEDQRSGIPTEAEIAMKKSKLKKMHEKRAENRRLKKNAALAQDTMLSPPQLESAPSRSDKSTEENSFSLRSSDLSMALAPRIIIQDGKAVINTASMPKLERFISQELSIVDNKKSKRVTSMSFKVRNHTEKWTADETTKFFKAIEIFGADFSMIAKLFPKRNRAQIKNKFRKEEKESPELMDHAFKRNKLLSKKPLMDRLDSFGKTLMQEGIFLSDSLDTTSDSSLNQLDCNFDSMDAKIMDQLQEMYQMGLQAQRAINLNWNGHSLLKKIDSPKSLSLSNRSSLAPSLETMSSLRAETSIQEAVVEKSSYAKLNQPEMGRHLLFNLMQK